MQQIRHIATAGRGEKSLDERLGVFGIGPRSLPTLGKMLVRPTDDLTAVRLAFLHDAGDLGMGVVKRLVQQEKLPALPPKAFRA